MFMFLIGRKEKTLFILTMYLPCYHLIQLVVNCHISKNRATTILNMKAKNIQMKTFLK
ncbi:Uncharacterised protein [Serratia fonticola]|nr:Uncharacterised protein [Serratia fonticola]CAI1997358.1 Uncharacterised protein [Serratia fonticola]CAI2000654.1 Uncharacterised protein [Serratia fonticola]